MRIPLNQKTQPRLPTAFNAGSALATDGLLQNLIVDMTADEGATVTKRPGLRFSNTTGPGNAQGTVTYNNEAYVFCNWLCYRCIDTGTGGFGSLPDFPSGPGAAITDRIYCLNSNQIANGQTAIVKHAQRLWVMTAGTPFPTFTECTDSNYPRTGGGGSYNEGTVAGLGYLDGTYYVMTVSGKILGSALENPLSWPALNVITTDSGIGAARHLTRHLNYILALCENGLQFFYDAGNATGSPLSPIPNAVSGFGCASGDSIAQIDDHTIFASKNKQKGRSISMITGLAVETISNPYIDRILTSDYFTDVYASAFKTLGHSFYMLTSGSGNYTLICDLTSREWSSWCTGTPGGAGATFAGYFYAYASGDPSFGYNRDIFVGRSNSRAYSLDPLCFADGQDDPTLAVSLIEVFIRTPRMDFGIIDNKTCSSLAIVGDTVAGSTVTVSYSDNDGTTYSTPRSIDMSKPWKILKNLGSFRARMFAIRHFANTYFRARFLELEVRSKRPKGGE